MSLHIPAAWGWFFDEIIPAYVKQHYSPNASWKEKPFTRQDAMFFIKGIRELSDRFTEDHESSSEDYFGHPRFRSSYLLYFLPLQASKFTTLFQLHSAAWETALLHAKENKNILRIADLGCGPGTASLAALLALLETTRTQKDFVCPKVELYLCDENKNVMKDAVNLLEIIASQFPKLRGQVTIITSVSPWHQWIKTSDARKPFSLVLMGHVLNESSRNPLESLRAFLPYAQGGGILIAEPADKRSSQMISRLRDQLIEMTDSQPGILWGPCLHLGKCPLAHGRDWCHFSIPISIPGEWFKFFSKGLSKEKEWIKLSYLWIASGLQNHEEVPPHYRLVVSDPIKPKSLNINPRSKKSTMQPTHRSTLLLCEPQEPRRIEVSAMTDYKRGDIYELPTPNKISSTKKLVVKKLTKKS